MRNPEANLERQASGFRTGIRALTTHSASVCIQVVKWSALLLLVGLFSAATSCTTLVNRRDLYSPEPASDSLEAARQWYGVTTTTSQPNGRFCLTRAASVSWTRAALPSRRLRFAFFVDSK
jgi:hypothetical protein